MALTSALFVRLFSAQVHRWLEKEGFPTEAGCFREEEIDGASLLLMRRMDVLTGIGIRLGPAIKIFEKVRGLQAVSDLE